MLIISLIVLSMFFLYHKSVKSESDFSILINEIMYNPLGSDTCFEWIELYNPSSTPVNITGWIISDEQEEDQIFSDLIHGNGSLEIPSKKYAIITDQDTQIYENLSLPFDTIKLVVDDNSICGYGLNNNNEKIILKDNNENIVDAVEWGFDYEDVEGYPAYCVNEGNSLSRYIDVDQNNSILDFFYGIIPTPGSKNNLDIDICSYPYFISKVREGHKYSYPFSIKINFSMLNKEDYYQLKSYIIGNLSSIYPSSQTWNNGWTYSYNYTHSFFTNNYRNYSSWYYLRFCNEYQEYKKNIHNNSEAYLVVKFKNEFSTYHIIKKLELIDLSENPINCTRAGYVVGQARLNESFLNNITVIVKNNSGLTTGIYFSEDNKIDDDLPTIPGYYKIPTPIGSGYTIDFYDNNKLIYSIPNIDVYYGDYKLIIISKEDIYKIKRDQICHFSIIIKNIGNFSDIVNLKINYSPDDCNVILSSNKIYLNKNEMSQIQVCVIPTQSKINQITKICFNVSSEKDPGIFFQKEILIEFPESDLTISNLTAYDINGIKQNNFFEGEQITLKATLKNIGNENVSNANVTFFYDYIDNDHIIGTKFYESVTKYTKYPSTVWDTSNIIPKNYTIFAVADYNLEIEEFNESNNIFSNSVKISESKSKLSNILITEIYYYSHTNVKNEYIAIFNPTNHEINISGWYLTNDPEKQISEQSKIIFPKSLTMYPRSKICITQNATDFIRETGINPDFEYEDDSNKNISQLEIYKSIRLSNNKGAVALKDQYNHTIDAVVYGEYTNNITGWENNPVESCKNGVVLKRNFIEFYPMDTNQSSDWEHSRIFSIGQSEFQFNKITFEGNITTFASPDCSYKAISNELKNAKHSIYFNMYEFTSPYLFDELILALKRNVSVFIFLEGSPIGGLDNREIYILNSIYNHGGHIRFIVNDPESRIYSRYTYDHAKYLVIDNKTVIVESCNWVKTGIPIDPSFGNREWGIIIRNEQVAKYFLDVFLSDWNEILSDSCPIEKMNFEIPIDFYLDYTEYKGSYEPNFDCTNFNVKTNITPIFSPDNSEQAICDLIDSATDSIYIQQLYVYRDWDEIISPFVERLVNKSKQGVKIKVILNYNPSYEPTNEKLSIVKTYFEENGIEVKFHYVNWSIFTNVHNKGMIVDNKSVLISSINWNENSVRDNREAGVIIENKDIARYYLDVFFYDWELKPQNNNKLSLIQYKNPLLIALIYLVTFGLVINDWRKRKWN